MASYNPVICTSLGKVLLAHTDLPLQKLIIDHSYKKDIFKKYTTNTISSKKALLEELNKIKSQAYAVDREEFEIGLICVAVPVYNMRNQVVASLSASGPANRF